MALPDVFRVWIVDRKPEAQELVARSVGEPSFLHLRHIQSGEELLEELQTNLFSPDQLPHIIMLDFFLETMFANELIPQIMQLFETTPELKPYLIAFASMNNANDAMLALGAEWSILKDKTAETLPEVQTLFASRESIGQQLGLQT